MEHEVTERMRWIEIDGPNGTDFVPEDVFADPDAVCARIDAEDECSAETWRILRDYTENPEPYAVSLTTGHGARLTMPGYLDCTAWSVHETADAAEQYLAETYDDA